MGLLDETTRAVEGVRPAADALKAQHTISARLNGVDVGTNARGVPIYLDGDERAVDPRDRPGASWGIAKSDQAYFNRNYETVMAAIRLDLRKIQEAEEALARAEQMAEAFVRLAQDAQESADVAKAAQALQEVAAAEAEGRERRRSPVRSL